VPCADSLRVHAYFDGEVDALAAGGVEAHIEACEDCRDLLRDLEQMRAGLRRDLTYERAPSTLRARVMAALDEESAAAMGSTETGAAVMGSVGAMVSGPEASVAGSGRAPTASTAQEAGAMGPAAVVVSGSEASAADLGRAVSMEGSAGGRSSVARSATPRPGSWRSSVARASMLRGRSFWVGAFSGVGGAALAAGLAFLLVMPRFDDVVVDDIVSAHLRSLMPAHLIDVVSTDRHTVKPWFATHTDVSPPVADFEAQGYKLIGGRADYFDRQRAAVVVYQHGSHVINVFSWHDEQRGVPRNGSRNGFHLAFWRAGNVVNCAVSDAGWDEVFGLTRLLQNLSTQESGKSME
jgi:anti-sigma factor RsiW